MDDYKDGDLFKVTFDVRLPCNATGKQIEEWLNFSLNWRGQIMKANPLAFHGLDAACEPSWSKR